MAEIDLVQGDVVRSMTGTIVNCDHQKMQSFSTILCSQLCERPFLRTAL
ncbi:MAG: hypothetical protein IKX42_10610 [Fibrobacter sp.]|nr:hypothetical protein [Fibrobacter sp.]